MDVPTKRCDLCAEIVPPDTVAPVFISADAGVGWHETPAHVDVKEACRACRAKVHGAALQCLDKRAWQRLNLEPPWSPK